jgi:hypothetical protein
MNGEQLGAHCSNWRPVQRIGSFDLFWAEFDKVFEVAFLTKALNRAFHGVQRKLRQYDHAGVGDKRPVVFCAFLQILLEPYWIVEENGKTANSIEFHHDVAQITSALSLKDGLFREALSENQPGSA